LSQTGRIGRNEPAITGRDLTAGSNQRALDMVGGVTCSVVVASDLHRCERNRRGEEMLTALILVCSLAITPELRNCDRNNAVQVLQVPEQFGNPVMCMMHGQAYLAGTSIGQEIRDSEQVKVLCIRSGNLIGKIG
jgi:hypothetical protein